MAEITIGWGQSFAKINGESVGARLSITFPDGTDPDGTPANPIINLSINRKTSHVGLNGEVNFSSSSGDLGGRTGFNWKVVEFSANPLNDLTDFRIGIGGFTIEVGWEPWQLPLDGEKELYYLEGVGTVIFDQGVIDKAYVTNDVFYNTGLSFNAATTPLLAKFQSELKSGIDPYQARANLFASLIDLENSGETVFRDEKSVGAAYLAQATTDPEWLAHAALDELIAIGSQFFSAGLEAVRLIWEEVKSREDNCFGSEVPIGMWPLDPEFAPDPSNPRKQYDQDAVRANVWTKPIALIRTGDYVVSHDKNGNMVPGYVSRTMTNDAKVLLNFFGTRVTPGHAFYRPDSKRVDKYETLIDILRDDGMIEHSDGRKLRAAICAPVDGPLDGFVQAITGTRRADGSVDANNQGRIRLGTRFIVGQGKDRKSFTVADLIKAGGGVVGDDELIRVGDGSAMPFHWDFGDRLPKPEDFVLACSGTTLEDIYKAAEWESQGPRLPAPMVLDRGHVQPLKGAMLSAMPRNEPLDVEHYLITSVKPQPTLNHSQRKAIEAKQRQAAKVTQGDRRLRR